LYHYSAVALAEAQSIKLSVGGEAMARQEVAEKAAERLTGSPVSWLMDGDTEEARAARLAEARASYEAEHIRFRRELGSAEELLDIGEIPTIEYLERELDLMDRLDGFIDRCVKRLLMVRGLKSISQPADGKRALKRIA
jgi:hypothetical protein